MKKVIKGRLCDTETAKRIGEWDNGAYDFSRCEEALYLTRSGLYFIAGSGGPRSKYAVSHGNNTSGGSDIYVVTVDEAREWAEEHLTADEYTAAFELSDDAAMYAVYLSPETGHKLNAIKQRTGESIKAIVARLVDAASDET